MKKLLIALAILLALPSITFAQESETSEENTGQIEYKIFGKVYLLKWLNGDFQFDTIDLKEWKEKLTNKERNKQTEESEDSEEKEVPEQEKEQAEEPKEEVDEQPVEVDENDEAEVTEKEEEKDEETVTSVSEFEKEVVRLTNIEREKHGLAPLELDEALSHVARDKSKDMRDAGYFSHHSPNYGSPFDMMNAYGIDYKTAGENIAAGQRTPQEVVNGWMNSDGHRANILNGSYTHIGVGHAEGGSYGHYWTQMFISK